VEALTREETRAWTQISPTPEAGSHTQAGSLIGTPGFIAPEQAVGEIERVNERSDVFGLGALLAVILTGKPPYVGDTFESVRVQAVRGKLEDCFARLDASGAEPEWLALCKKCLAFEPAERPADAGEVAQAVAGLRAAADERARRAELERVQAEGETRAALARAAQQRQRRRLLLAAGGIIALVLLAGLSVSLWQMRRAIEAETAANTNAELANRNADEANAEKQKALRAALDERRAKQRADITLADMYTSRGLLAADRNSAAEAVLWFAAAADQSATAEDSQRHEDNRLRARNWMRRATLPVGALSLSGGVHQLDFQPRGDLLLVRFGKSQVIFWSWRDGKRLPWAEKLTGVGAAQFSPDGASVALGFLSGEAQIRKVSDGELLARIRHQGAINALTFSPDGKFLAVASHIARVWDIKRQAFLDPAWSHPQGVSALLFNRKGDRLITTCGDKRVRVFAMEGPQDRQQPLYAPLVHTVASPPALIDEDRIVVTVSRDSELTRWDMTTGKPAAKPIQTKPSNLQGVVASPDGNWFVTGGYYGPELYAADANQPPVHLSHQNLVMNYAFSPDNTMLLSVSRDLTARIWSLPQGQPLGQPLRHMANGERCAWSHDSRYFVTAQYDGLIRVWQRPDADLVIAEESTWGGRQRPRVSFDGRLVVPGLWYEAPGGAHNQNVMRLRVVAAANGQPAGPAISLPGVLVDSCVCGDNRAVAAVVERGKDGLLGVWDVATGHARFEPVTLPGQPMSVAARPATGQLAVACSTGDLLVIDDKTGKRVLELRHEGGWKVRYTPDGKTLVSRATLPENGGTVNVLDADTGKLRFAPLRPSVAGSSFFSFSISADSRRLATTTLVKNYAQVWDLATGRPLSEPLPHPGDFWGLFSVRFSPDGRYLITSHKDGQVRYWDWQAGKLACPSMAHDSETHDATITPDGRFALTPTGGREMHVWELTTGRLVAPPVRLSFHERVFCSQLAITPDGRRAWVAVWPGLAVVDLEALLSPSITPTADLALLAELATAQRIDVGDLSGLTTDQWLERWNRLRERNPGLARSFLSEPSPETIRRKGIVQAVAQTNLGAALSRKGQWDKATACWKKAIALDATNATAHFNLGVALSRKGQLDQAIACWKTAIALDPNYAWAHGNLGVALARKGQVDEAIASFRKAIELDPKDAWDHANLGTALMGKGQLDEAIACFKKAIELDPKNGMFALRMSFAQAQIVSRDKRLAASRDKLPAFLNGSYTPASNAERLNLAEWCKIKKLHHAATGLYAAAFAADPKLADDLRAFHRYNAACYAALAAAGQGADAAKLDATERTRLRKQALDWLRADLALRTKQLESGKPHDRAAVQRALKHWQQDTDLAGLRDPAALEKLPAEERAACAKLWADVAALLKKTDEKTAQDQKLAQAEPPAVLNEAIQKNPDKADGYRKRGEWFGERGRWKEAAADFAAVFRLEPSTYDGMRLGMLLLQIGDINGYRQHCQVMLKRWATTEKNPEADMTLKTIMFLPDYKADAKQLARLAQVAVSGDKNVAWYEWHQIAKGLHDYRTGKYDDALATCRDSRRHASTTKGDPDALRVLNLAIEAMAFYAKGDAGEARRTLDQAKSVLKDHVPGIDGGAGWPDRLAAHILYREAEALIRTKKVGPGK
jgi:WD40 repeat protein/tetratricopeptide (TPR) repeat protein